MTLTDDSVTAQIRAAAGAKGTHPCMREAAGILQRLQQPSTLYQLAAEAELPATGCHAAGCQQQQQQQAWHRQQQQGMQRRPAACGRSDPLPAIWRRCGWCDRQGWTPAAAALQYQLLLVSVMSEGATAVQAFASFCHHWWLQLRRAEVPAWLPA